MERTLHGRVRQNLEIARGFPGAAELPA